jgi:peptidoglycan/xylan/chitin deacetylase (PgdA/CDA1 family)
VYHDVQPTLAGTGGNLDHFTVSASGFECMLDTIASGAYRGCSLEDAFADPSPRVGITFDDGTLGQYEFAVPALLARGMTATFYVTTDWVGRAGYMTWEQLRELAASGMSIQSHTRSHRPLSELSRDDVRLELESSKSELEDRLGRCAVEIAFPGGDPPPRRLRYLVAESGYRVAVGTRWGVNHGISQEATLRRFVKRCTVRRDTTPALARQIVEAEAWLGLRSIAKERALRAIRSTLGASRYLRWREKVLDALTT